MSTSRPESQLLFDTAEDETQEAGGATQALTEAAVPPDSNANALANNMGSGKAEVLTPDTDVAVKDLESNEVKVKKPIRMDGGYGWVIVFVAFYSNFVVDGVANSFGNMRDVVQKYTGKGDEVVAFIGSCLIGMYLLIGPVASIIMNKFGPRICCAVGGILASGALLASTLSSNIIFLIAVYGFVVGAGFGLMYLPAVVVVCYYFDKKRALATGIGVAGSGAGTIVIPKLVALLQKKPEGKEYTGQEFIPLCYALAGITFSSVLMGMLYKTTDSRLNGGDKGKKDKSSSKTSKSNNLPSTIDPSKELGENKSEKDKPNGQKKGDSGKKGLSSIIDVGLMKDPLMIVLIISNIFGMLGFYVPFVYSKELAEKRGGVTEDEATNLISIIGATNTVGRLFFGWLADKKWLSALTINNICLLASGVVTVIAPFACGMLQLVSYASFFGLFVSAYICMTSILLADLFGVERVSSAFGLVVVGRAVGSFFGTPLAGNIKQTEKKEVVKLASGKEGLVDNINIAFYVGGALIIFGALLSFLIPYMAKRKAAKEAAQGKEADTVTLNTVVELESKPMVNNSVL